jgi:hypothetical protein
MRHYFVTIFLLTFITLCQTNGQISSIGKGLDAITGDAIKAQLGFLSSDWMEGREAGEKGEYMASDYIASMLKIYGVAPWGDYIGGNERGEAGAKTERSYFQNFVLLKNLPGDEQLMRINISDSKLTKSLNLTFNVDFTLRPADQGIEIEAPVVFAGYAFVDDSSKYNDLSKLDLRGKFILKITGYPKFINIPADWEKAAALRNKMEAIYNSMGVAGVIEFDPDASVVGQPEPKDFMNMSPSEGPARHGGPRARYSIPGKNFAYNLPRIQISAKAASEILDGSGIKPDEYRHKADRNEKTTIPELKGKAVYLKTSVKTTQVAVRNIIGIIEGKHPDKYIVIAAHYDHIGMSNGYIWNGADDNGSGTVGVMTIAKAIAATGEKPENSIVFALWTAEEEGLLGSRYWVRNLGFPVSDIKLNMNFDMISRYISDNEPKKVTMTYTSSFPWFRDITAANLEKYGIDLIVDFQPSSNPPGGTDHRSFVEAGVPVIRIKPGHREEYHTPMDEVKTVNWDIMEKIIKLGFSDCWELANREWK